MDGDNRERSESLLWLLDAYRAVEPVKTLLAELKVRHARDTEWLSLEFQDDVMDTVVHDAIVDKYSPPRAYTYRFLKAYADALDREAAELSDLLVSDLMEFVALGRVKELTATDSEEMHHVTYRVPNGGALGEDLTITCRVASVFNEVGLKIWEAGFFLAEFILAHRGLFVGRSVLELGAGVGFTGFVLAKCVPAARVIVSDYAPNVMLNLRYNTEINEADEPYMCPVSVETIDWETWDPTLEASNELRPDILLAGDCVYDVGAFPLLVQVLQNFLGDSMGSQLPHDLTAAEPEPLRYAIFAATIRNQSTFQTFLDTLDKFEIVYEDITGPAIKKMATWHVFRYENRDQIRLCKLYRRPPQQ